MPDRPDRFLPHRDVIRGRNNVQPLVILDQWFDRIRVTIEIELQVRVQVPGLFNPFNYYLRGVVATHRINCNFHNRISLIEMCF